MIQRLSVIFLLFFSMQSSAFEVPVDSNEFIYGVGTDVSYDLAQKSAMADIVAKLSTRINTEISIDQTKRDSVTKTTAKSTTRAVTSTIELPNVDVVKSEQKKGRWQVLVRVKRQLVQRAIYHQLTRLHEDVLFVLDDFDALYTPSCFYALSDELSNVEQLKNLIPAYLGSGVNDNSEQAFYQTIKQFSRTFKRCKQRNRYTLTFSQPVTAAFKNATKELLKNSGFEVVKTGNNTGTIQFNIKKKQTLVYKSHLTVLAAEILVFDENESLKFKSTFKVKGSSFDSQQDALTRAENKLFKKIKLR